MKRLLLVFGIVVLMLGARSALAQTQTCPIITGPKTAPGVGSGGVVASPT